MSDLICGSGCEEGGRLHQSSVDRGPGAVDRAGAVDRGPGRGGRYSRGSEKDPGSEVRAEEERAIGEDPKLEVVSAQSAEWSSWG